MSLTYLNQNTIANAVTCAWKKAFGTSDTPQQSGLISAFTDNVPSALVLNTDAATVTTSQTTAETNIVNNADGLLLNYTYVTLSSTSSQTTSSTHTTTTSVTEGTSFNIEVNEELAKEGATFNLSFTFTSSESETTSTTDSDNYSTQVQVFAPKGKVQEAVLVEEIQQMSVPYTCVVQVTGNSNCVIDKSGGGDDTGQASAGQVFGWIQEYNCAGDDSSSYSDGGNGIGLVTMTGTVTVSQTANFTSQVNDVTEQTRLFINLTSADLTVTLYVRQGDTVGVSISPYTAFDLPANGSIYITYGNSTNPYLNGLSFVGTGVTTQEVQVATAGDSNDTLLNDNDTLTINTLTAAGITGSNIWSAETKTTTS
ncbi:MAG TPA: hypothetical protein VKB93_05865 [Thermoanaerobaculia bacterium]|nr:hypothetical protein [Thermoanaerobaculia bacterium]